MKSEKFLEIVQVERGQVQVSFWSKYLLNQYKTNESY